MYEKYTTDAIALAEREHRERDKVFALYTRDFGLIQARASAVRAMSSKMRPALVLFACPSVSLVRGTRGWRVTGARAGEYGALPPAAAHAFARIAQLLTRLVRGEERNEYLFDTLAGAREALAEDSLGAVELLCVARMLYALGYISPQALSTALFSRAHFAGPDLEAVESERAKVLKIINTAIAESQL